MKNSVQRAHEPLEELQDMGNIYIYEYIYIYIYVFIMYIYVYMCVHIHAFEHAFHANSVQRAQNPLLIQALRAPVSSECVMSPTPWTRHPQQPFGLWL